MAPDPKEVAHARKLHEMRGTGDPYRKAAIEKKLKQLPPDVHAAAKAHAHVAPKGGVESRVRPTPSEGAQYLLDHGIAPLPDIPDVMTGGTMSYDAKKLLEDRDQAGLMATDIAEARRQFQSVLDEIPPLVQKVKHASGEITDLAHHDTELRKDIDEYARGGPELNSAAEKMSDAYSKFLAAATRLDIAKEQKDIRGANEDLNKAKESLKELEDKKKELREGVGKVVEYGKEILKDPLDPESYQTLLTDASKYLEGKVLDFLVGDYFGPQLEEARKALATAQKKVDDLTSLIEANVIEAASKDLDGAYHAYKASREDLQVAVEKRDAGEREVFDKLVNRSGAARAAAAAIATRDDAANMAENLMKAVTGYLALCTSITKDAHTLSSHYKNYSAELLKERKRLQDDIDPPVTAAGKQLFELQKIEEHNQAKVGEIEGKAKDEKQQAEQLKSYLEGGSYMKIYKELEEVLRNSVKYA